MVSPARWLSFTRTKSDNDPRWFTPPPARTAAFSRARRPGVVLRVSHTRQAGLAAATASTKRRVSDATPDRWHRKLSAVRSAVSTDASGPVTVAITSPGPTRSPSARCQVTVTAGSTRANVSAAQAVPATTPSARARMAAATLASGGTRAAVRSPSGPRSSAKARATASCTAGAGGSNADGTTAKIRGMGDHRRTPHVAAGGVRAGGAGRVHRGLAGQRDAPAPLPGGRRAHQRPRRPRRGAPDLDDHRLRRPGLVQRRLRRRAPAAARRRRPPPGPRAGPARPRRRGRAWPPASCAATPSSSARPGAIPPTGSRGTTTATISPPVSSTPPPCWPRCSSPVASARTRRGPRWCRRRWRRARPAWCSWCSSPATWTGPTTASCSASMVTLPQAFMAALAVRALRTPPGAATVPAPPTR